MKVSGEQISQDRHNMTLFFSWLVNKNIDIYALLNDYEID